MELTYRIESKNGWDSVSLQGHINEDAELVLAQLKEHLNPQCLFNLKDIKSINSCGVRAWINFMREAGKDRHIVFEECPPEVVSQINMIPNFKGNAKIQSVYASYICEACNHQKLELFVAGKNLPSKAGESLAEVKCPNCQEPMEMEELEEEFFGWLNLDT